MAGVVMFWISLRRSRVQPVFLDIRRRRRVDLRYVVRPSPGRSARSSPGRIARCRCRASARSDCRRPRDLRPSRGANQAPVGSTITPERTVSVTWAVARQAPRAFQMRMVWPSVMPSAVASFGMQPRLLAAVALRGHARDACVELTVQACRPADARSGADRPASLPLPSHSAGSIQAGCGRQSS